MESSAIFVFYTVNENNDKTNWTYGKFPDGWGWTGAGSTSPVGGELLEYRREEQFNGPIEYRKQMRGYLDGCFAGLKKRGIIKKYKIRNSYKP